MAEWMMWFGLAGALVITEMFTGTFYLLMIGLGFAAGGFAALTGAGVEAQLLAAAIVGSIATYGLRRSKWGKVGHSEAGCDPNVNLDIDQTLVVDSWTGAEGEARTARAMYRGAFWDVELQPGANARAGVFVIREIRGNRLIVANSNPK